LWLRKISSVIYTLREVMIDGAYSAIPKLNIQIQHQYWLNPPLFALACITWI
jgi:hypothetical protein